MVTKASSPLPSLGTQAPRGISVYEHLRDRLRAELVAPGTPGQRVPGEKALALQFGVSPVTMSRALQELQNEGVILRVPGKGTFLAEVVRKTVNEGAALKGASIPVDPWNTLMNRGALPSVDLRAAIIAPLGVDEIGKRYANWEPRIVSRLEQLIQGSGGSTTVANSDTVPLDKTAIEALRETKVNAVFVVRDVNVLTENSLAGLQKWQQDERGLIVTGISMGSRGEARIGGIGYDGNYGAFLIGQHLNELKHQRVAYVVPDEPVYETSNGPVEFLMPRLEALRSAQTASDGVFTEEVRVPAPSDAQRYEGGSQLPLPEHDIWISCGESAARNLELEERFTALVFANDNMARGYLQTMREMGRKITASIVGYDDRTFASSLGLTTVRPPIEEMAEYAFHIARSHLSQPFEAGHIDITLKPSLTRRASTRMCK